MNLLRLSLPAIIGLTGLFSPVQAALIFTLDQDGCTGTCGAAPFGTVTLVQTTATLVTVTETLSGWFAGTGAGDALEFNVAGPIVIGNLIAGFAVGPSPDTASKFGGFLASVTCTVCQGGNQSNPAGPLSFTITSATGISISDFKANGGGYYFASDIIGRNGNTGNVAARNSITPVPEPASFVTLLSGVGLLGLGITIRHFHMGRK